ncbi:MAG: hypothetical protein ACKVS6_11365 [Planctomycetota bacterium]
MNTSSVTNMKLEEIAVASPCPAAWVSMTGNDRVRHCIQCKLNVYNISAMTSSAATALINEKEGRLCVRFFRRKDGTLITADCPVGLRAAARKTALLTMTILAGVIAIVVSITAAQEKINVPCIGGGTSGRPAWAQFAVDKLVTVLPEWMIPESWKPKEPFEITMGVRSFSYPESSEETSAGEK